MPEPRRSPKPPVPDPGDLAVVRHTARLARLAVEPDEEQRLAAQFGRILAAFRSLSELDLGDSPSDPPQAAASAARPDETRPSLAPDELLGPAPERVDDFFSVPKTIGGSS